MRVKFDFGCNYHDHMNLEKVILISKIQGHKNSYRGMVGLPYVKNVFFQRRKLGYQNAYGPQNAGLVFWI